ncbi:unnamed protein product [Calypogeia fissa]
MRRQIILIDMLPEDGAPSGMYTRTVETLSNSLARYNAVIIELGREDATVCLCFLSVFFHVSGFGDWFRVKGDTDYRVGPNRDNGSVIGPLEVACVKRLVA